MGETATACPWCAHADGRHQGVGRPRGPVLDDDARSCLDCDRCFPDRQAARRRSQKPWVRPAVPVPDRARVVPPADPADGDRAAIFHETLRWGTDEQARAAIRAEATLRGVPAEQLTREHGLDWPTLVELARDRQAATCALGRRPRFD